MNRCFRCKSEGTEIVRFTNGDVSIACSVHADVHRFTALRNRAIREAEEDFRLALKAGAVARQHEDRAREALRRARGGA